MYQDLLGSWGYQHPNAAGPAHESATWFRNAVKDYAQDPNLMFRGEGFNFVNHTNFLNPSGNIGSATFGRVTSARDPRLVQLTMRYFF